MHSETDERDIEKTADDDAVADPEAVRTDEGDDDHAETVVMSEDSFSDPDISMEVNVEKLVAELEKSEGEDAHRKAEIRRRLEELAEENSFEDTFAIDINDD